MYRTTVGRYLGAFKTFFFEFPQFQQVMSRVMSTYLPIRSDNGIEGIEELGCSIPSIPSIPNDLELTDLELMELSSVAKSQK